MRLSDSLISLRNRNFSLFFWGQMISRVGMWMQRTAVIWVVYEITDSAFMIGVATFAEQFPSFVFSVRGGIIADQYNRYKALMVTQVLSALQAVALAACSFADNKNVTLILLLSVFLGIVNAYDVPVRQSMINEIVENKEELPNAVALNSSLNTFARLIGPAFAGFVLAKYGASFCFVANAVSFIAVIGGIAAMRFPENTFETVKTRSRGRFKEAIVYLQQNRLILTVIIIAALSNLLVLPFVTLLPVYTKEVFHGNAATFGWLNAAMGVGAFAGSFYLAAGGKDVDFRRQLQLNTFMMGASLVLFAYSTSLPVSLLLLVLLGFSSICQTSIIITIVQTDTDKAFRGRIMSFIAMAIFGMMPLGSLLVGRLAPLAGNANVLCVEGLLSIIIGMAFRKNLIALFQPDK
ncbi:MAG: MFS transporter [Chitinophagaceae bacterium]